MAHTLRIIRKNAHPVGANGGQRNEYNPLIQAIGTSRVVMCGTEVKIISKILIPFIRLLELLNSSPTDSKLQNI